MELEEKDINRVLIFSIKKLQKKLKRSKALKRIRKNNWTDEEDKLLISLCSEKKRKNWISIANFFKDKSLNSCKLRFFQINPKIKKGTWTAEEDKKLYYLVNQFGLSWSFISKVLKDRNHKQIRSRYLYYFVYNKVQNHINIKRLEQEFSSGPGDLKK